MAKIDIDAFVVSLHNMMFDGSVEKARMERILSEQGLEIVDGKKLERKKGLPILENEWYVCIKDWPYRNGIAHKGGIYYGMANCCMIGDDGKRHFWYSNEVNSDYFRKATTDDIQNIYKFNENDWVVCPNNGRIGQIVGRYFGFYKILHFDKIKEYIIEADKDFVDTNCHRWTISDARCGDILVDGHGNIGIYKDNTVHTWDSILYIGSKGDYVFYHGGTHTVFSENDVRPANFLQTQLIFSALGRDGFTWDDETKKCVSKDGQTVEHHDAECFDDLSNYEKEFDSIAEEYITTPDNSIGFIKGMAKKMLNVARREIEREQNEKP